MHGAKRPGAKRSRAWGETCWAKHPGAKRPEAKRPGRGRTSRERNVHVHRANHPGSESSRGRIVLGQNVQRANCPGRTVQGAKRPGGEMFRQGAKRLEGETARGQSVHTLQLTRM